MSTKNIKDLSRLCIHTATTRPLPIEVTVELYSKYGVKGITLWREAYEEKKLSEIKRLISDRDLKIISICRGGFFPALSPEKRKIAIKENIRIIDEAYELGAPLIVLVCGAIPEISLDDSRKQIEEGINEIKGYAESAGIKLGIEPLHPMYADSRSAINTLKQANDICDRINSKYIGVIIDVYHLWWDPELEKEIKRCGQIDKIFGFHISDWKSPTTDLLNDRGLMGEGCIPIKKIRGWVESAGFDGFHEVEIFSNMRWKMNQELYIKEIVTSYLKYS